MECVNCQSELEQGRTLYCNDCTELLLTMHSIRTYQRLPLMRRLTLDHRAFNKNPGFVAEPLEDAAIIANKAINKMMEV